jgi:hypothetical protein
MILVWNSADSFNRHLEMVKTLRRSLQASVKRDWYLLRDMPVLQGITLKNNAGGVSRQCDTSNRPVIVPIRKITMPGNFQN